MNIKYSLFFLKTLNHYHWLSFVYFLSAFCWLLPAEFRESRAGKDFFETCRSPEACCELTLQVYNNGSMENSQFRILRWLSLNFPTLLFYFYFFILASETFSFWCCHHLLWHPGRPTGRVKLICVHSYQLSAHKCVLLSLHHVCSPLLSWKSIFSSDKGACSQT